MEFWSDGAKTLTNQNPKSEARNPKQAEILKFAIQKRNPKRTLFGILCFDHLDLFRDSDFEFRVFPAFHFLGVPFDFRDHMLCATPGPSW